MKKFAAAAILPAMLFIQPAVANDDLLILEDRIADLEQQIDNQVKVAGYVDVEYVDSSKSGANPGIRMHHLSLFFKQQISEDWRFFSEIEYEDAPLFEGTNDPSDLTLKKSEGKIYAEAINLDYTMRPDLNFRMGRFFTPAGIWSIDHYPPYVPTQERPMHIRKIFPQLVDGLMVFGGKPVGSSFLNYNVYLGNGEGNPGKKDLNSSKGLGIKAKLTLPSKGRPQFGGTYYKDTLNDSKEKSAIGVDFKMTVKKVTVQAEYADAEMTPTSGMDYNIKGYYAQFLYTPNRWTYGYRYDFYDADSRVADGDKTVDSFIVNYRINSNLILKLEHHLIDEEDPTKEDYDKTIVSIAANLGG